jgi:hypothetical protein
MDVKRLVAAVSLCGLAACHLIAETKSKRP